MVPDGLARHRRVEIEGREGSTVGWEQASGRQADTRISAGEDGAEAGKPGAAAAIHGVHGAHRALVVVARYGRAARSEQEVQVSALISLLDVLDVELGVAAAEGRRRW